MNISSNLNLQRGIFPLVIHIHAYPLIPYLLSIYLHLVFVYVLEARYVAGETKRHKRELMITFLSLFYCAASTDTILKSKVTTYMKVFSLTCMNEK